MRLKWHHNTIKYADYTTCSEEASLNMICDILETVITRNSQLNDLISWCYLVIVPDISDKTVTKTAEGFFLKCTSAKSCENNHSL